MVVVCGTGTSVGKTRVAAGLVRGAVEAGVGAVGLKPIETGVASGRESDATCLARWAGRSGAGEHFFAGGAPVSPHLAARAAGVEIRIEAVLDWIARRRGELTVVETAGGLFSPIGEASTNLDLVLALGARPVLVCPGRLGVLHDVGASLGASAAVEWAAIVVSGTREDDDVALQSAEIERVVLPRLGVRSKVLRSAWSAEGVDTSLWASVRPLLGFT